MINEGILGKLQGRTPGLKMGEPSAIILTLASNLVVGGGTPIVIYSVSETSDGT